MKSHRAFILRLVLAATGVYAGWTLTFADPSYRASSSLQVASRVLPLWFWGVLLFIYAALLLTDIGDIGRIIGFALGAGLAAYFAVSFGWSITHPTAGKGRNGLVLAFLIDTAVLHAAAVRVTIERQVGRP